MQITVRFDGRRVMRSTKAIGDAVPDVGFRAIWKLFGGAMTRLKRYPPELPGQRYVRTGTYGRAFKLEKIGAGVIGARISNDARQKGRYYTVYVGGNALGMGQARIHQGRWEVIANVIDEEVTRHVVQEVEADLAMVIQQQGMGT